MDYNFYGQSLQQKRREIGGWLETRPTPQVTDEVNSQNHHNLRKTLAEIDEALVKTKDGTFGVCVDCRETIPEERLLILPWISRCLSCQKKEDSRSPKKRYW